MPTTMIYFGCIALSSIICGLVVVQGSNWEILVAISDLVADVVDSIGLYTRGNSNLYWKYPEEWLL